MRKAKWSPVVLRERLEEARSRLEEVDLTISTMDRRRDELRDRIERLLVELNGEPRSQGDADKE